MSEPEDTHKDAIRHLSNNERMIFVDRYWKTKINEIRHLYSDLNWSQKKIAEYYGVAPITISKLTRKHLLIKKKPFVKGQHKNICQNCNKEFYTHYSTKKKYCSKSCWMASHMKDKIVTRICKYCGKEFEVYVLEIEKDGKGVHCSKKCLVADYRAASIVTNCLQCGKEIRTPKARSKDNRGKFCSQSCAGTWRIMNTEGVYNSKRSRSGRREDLENRYFRSSWEANYARYLNWLIEHGEIKSWEYEVDTFRFPVSRGNMTYLPDFKITNNDNSVEYHEVKGYMDKDSTTKLKRMEKYYPDTKLVLIDKDVYSKLKRDVCRLIPNWEDGTAIRAICDYLGRCEG